MSNLPKARILRGHQVFSGILTRGKSVTSGSIRVFYTSTTHPGPLKAGFSVSRAIRKATVRNRIKRCLRESFRVYGGTPGAASRGTEVVFLYRGEKTDKPGRIDCRVIQKDMIAALQLLKDRINR